MNKKIFDSEFSAINFAKKINGTVRQSWLPGYMNVETIWIVEWK